MQDISTCYIIILHRICDIKEKRDKKMSDTYVECLVKAKQSGAAKFFKGALIALTAVFCVGMLVVGTISLVLAVACGVGAYFVSLYTDLEYEYLYLDRELVVDKVMAKSKRKRVATYSVDRIEILAPVKSYHLDSYKNRNVKANDYSVGEELQPDLRYVMFYEGGQKILLSPSEDLVKAMKSVAPRKVFTD